MDLANFRELLTSEGQGVLRAAMELQPREKDFLRDFQQLSKQFPREMARVALETAILRGEATSKFPQAEKMYFTREALEQASGYEVSSYRAERYRGYAQIADLGCSIGSDTLALAEVAPVIGIDKDIQRLAMAQANMKALGLEVPLIQTDLVNSFPCLEYPTVALYFDPARRANGRRIQSVKKVYSAPQYRGRMVGILSSSWGKDFTSRE